MGFHGWNQEPRIKNQELDNFSLSSGCKIGDLGGEMKEIKLTGFVNKKLHQFTEED
jgi:hypothetical protein